MLGWDKLESSREGSTLKRKEWPLRIALMYHMLSEFSLSLCVVKPLCQGRAQGMFPQSLSGYQERVLGHPEHAEM